MNILKAESVQKIYAAWYTGTVDHRYQLEVQVISIHILKWSIVWHIGYFSPHDPQSGSIKSPKITAIVTILDLNTSIHLWEQPILCISSKNIHLFFENKKFKSN